MDKPEASLRREALNAELAALWAKVGDFKIG